MCVSTFKEARRGCYIPWNCSYRELWAAWCGSWELNSVLLKEQQVVLTPEPPLHPNFGLSLKWSHSLHRPVWPRTHNVEPSVQQLRGPPALPPSVWAKACATTSGHGFFLIQSFPSTQFHTCVSSSIVVFLSAYWYKLSTLPEVPIRLEHRNLSPRSLR